MPFIAFSNFQIKWTDIDPGFGIIESKQVDKSRSTWNDRFASFHYCDDGISFEITLAPSASYSLDFTNLIYERLGFTLHKGWKKLNILIVENTSSSKYLTIGTSGLSNHLGITASDENVGPGGIFIYEQREGLTISNSTKNFRLLNSSSANITARFLAVGNLI